MIRDAARWMQRMVGDRLNQAALASGRVTLRRAAVAPEALIAEAVRLLGGQARAHAIEFETDVPAGLSRVIADPAHVLQVLANVIENAIAVSAPGATIRVEATPAAGGVEFAVRDYGPGIPVDDLPYLFEPFWRPTQDERRGTGLGLAIARSIVEAHGRTIDVRSAPGRGSTFAFTRPMEDRVCQTAADTGRQL